MTEQNLWRITVRSDERYTEGAIELAGRFAGDLDQLKKFAKAMKPYGLVIASPLGYDDD